MTISTIEESQRKAARVVGFAYLFAMVIAVFAESYVGGQLIVFDNAAETARNIMAHELLFRLGIASSLIIVVSDVALIAALYVILKRVNKNLAVFAAFLRLMQTAVYAVTTLNYLDVLRLLSGAGYLQAVGTDHLQALARLSIGSYGAGLNVAFVFLGLGSTVFGYLWFKSNYIAKALAVLGVCGSLLLAAGSFAIIIFPSLAKILSLAYMMPLGVFEITMGFWLLFKGLRPSGVAEPDKASG
ncbi:MAG: DUF4386 domain-containing protein [Acidobacteria bacterium]|nr:DUF4386 domain-containing protein [Acidobacteriota bacterium]MBI3655306.1 DUF4386 domain-containing protein [Acidobacteriota bacterium]